MSDALAGMFCPLVGVLVLSFVLGLLIALVHLIVKGRLPPE